MKYLIHPMGAVNEAYSWWEPTLVLAKEKAKAMCKTHNIAVVVSQEVGTFTPVQEWQEAK